MKISYIAFIKRYTILEMFLFQIYNTYRQLRVITVEDNKRFDQTQEEFYRCINVNMKNVFQFICQINLRSHKQDHKDLHAIQRKLKKSTDIQRRAISVKSESVFVKKKGVKQSVEVDHSANVDRIDILKTFLDKDNCFDLFQQSFIDNKKIYRE